MAKAKQKQRPLKHCVKCEGLISTPVLAPDAPELCPNCAMSADPGSEIAFRAGSGFCRACGGEHCPHYACTTGGGSGFCDGCSGDE